MLVPAGSAASHMAAQPMPASSGISRLRVAAGPALQDGTLELLFAATNFYRDRSPSPPGSQPNLGHLAGGTTGPDDITGPGAPVSACIRPQPGGLQELLGCPAMNMGPHHMPPYTARSQNAVPGHHHGDEGDPWAEETGSELTTARWGVTPRTCAPRFSARDAVDESSPPDEDGGHVWDSPQSAATPTACSTPASSALLTARPMSAPSTAVSSAATAPPPPMPTGPLPARVEIALVESKPGPGGVLLTAAELLSTGYFVVTASGIFDATRYLQQRTCIKYDGAWMSGAVFERAADSKVANWHRCIRVLPTLEPLGEWLERSGLPVIEHPHLIGSKRFSDCNAARLHQQRLHLLAETQQLNSGATTARTHLSEMTAGMRGGGPLSSRPGPLMSPTSSQRATGDFLTATHTPTRHNILIRSGQVFKVAVPFPGWPMVLTNSAREELSSARLDRVTGVGAPPDIIAGDAAILQAACRWDALEPHLNTPRIRTRRFTAEDDVADPASPAVESYPWDSPQSAATPTTININSPSGSTLLTARHMSAPSTAVSSPATAPIPAPAPPPGPLPDPVVVTVYQPQPPRPTSKGGAHQSGSPGGSDPFPVAPLRGIFDPARYLRDGYCIYANNTWMKRSHFMQASGANPSKLAARNILVLSTGELLGDWLNRHGLPPSLRFMSAGAGGHSSRVGPHGAEFVDSAAVAAGPHTARSAYYPTRATNDAPQGAATARSRSPPGAAAAPAAVGGHARRTLWPQQHLYSSELHRAGAGAAAHHDGSRVTQTAGLQQHQPTASGGRGAAQQATSASHQQSHLAWEPSVILRAGDLSARGDSAHSHRAAPPVILQPLRQVAGSGVVGLSGASYSLDHHHPPGGGGLEWIMPQEAVIPTVVVPAGHTVSTSVMTNATGGPTQASSSSTCISTAQTSGPSRQVSSSTNVRVARLPFPSISLKLRPLSWPAGVDGACGPTGEQYPSTTVAPTAVPLVSVSQLSRAATYPKHHVGGVGGGHKPEMVQRRMA
uniref:RlsN n=1 Tax=Volvox ferrisii TaxID=1075618 RepID=A0A075M1B6_9CHLO|nr:RlsN [Volvox ferrisii]